MENEGEYEVVNEGVAETREETETGRVVVVAAESGMDSCAARHSTRVSFAVWCSNAAFNCDSYQNNTNENIRNMLS